MGTNAVHLNTENNIQVNIRNYPRVTMVSKSLIVLGIVVLAVLVHASPMFEEKVEDRDLKETEETEEVSDKRELVTLISRLREFLDLDDQDDAGPEVRSPQPYRKKKKVYI